MIEKGGLKIFCLLMALSVPFLFIYLPIAVLLLFFAIFTAYFFRDPERKIGDGVVSPADGKIDYIANNRLEIFMSPFDCHVNRSPVSGRVLKTEFREGRVLPAFKRIKDPRMNEILIEGGDGIFKVIQIAGIFARRIVCYVKPGENLTKGERIGIIRFGSRVVLEVPEGYRFVKKVGEKVKAGETVAVKDENIPRG
ncbi:MAG: phosphatidylserine decarboxylase [Archaeoglobaceae archaeon]|nr:phosphatidylserine decarboxylase [Archaeoglobaceae archaeon]MDW8117678.1 phosphatidylserine decarboxylase [Archaeoglobaceae archaeon]